MYYYQVGSVCFVTGVGLDIQTEYDIQTLILVECS